MFNFFKKDNTPHLKDKYGAKVLLGNAIDLQYPHLLGNPWIFGILDKINEKSFEIIDSEKNRYICENNITFIKSNKLFCFTDKKIEKKIKVEDSLEFLKLTSSLNDIKNSIKKYETIINQLKEKINDVKWDLLCENSDIYKQLKAINKKLIIEDEKPKKKATVKKKNKEKK